VFVTVILLAGVAMSSIAIATMLATAQWPRRAPAAAILLWQALGLGWGLAAVGALAGLAARPEHTGVAGGVLAFAVSTVMRPDGQTAMPETFRLLALALSVALLALLCWVLAAACAAVLRTRRRHRALLALLGRGEKMCEIQNKI